MTEEEWDRYREIVARRIARRLEICRRAGWTTEPGGAQFHRTQWRLQHPEFGGLVDPHSTKTDANAR